MTRYSSRDRAEEAVKLRAREYTWQEIAGRLGFSSRGAVRLAADRRLQRTAPEAAPAQLASVLRCLENDGLMRLQRDPDPSVPIRSDRTARLS